MERKTGTIEDAVALAKSRYSSIDDQARYIQIAMDLIKRDYSDKVKSYFCPKDGFDYYLTGYGGAGGAYFWYNIFRGTVKVASVLEVYRDEIGQFEVLFSSNKDFPGPITPIFKE